MGIPRMLTINELASEYKGTGITAFRIRQLALSGEIVHLRAGKKILINADKFAEYLNAAHEEPKHPAGIVRRIEA